MRTAIAILGAMLFAARSGWAGDIILQPDRAECSTVTGADVTIEVGLDRTPSAGLFSYGVRVAYDLDLGPLIEEASAIGVPTTLDFNGVAGHGAVRAIGPGFAGVKGTIDVFASPVRPYTESKLAAFTLHFPRPCDYLLRFEPFDTLGQAKNIFVDGA